MLSIPSDITRELITLRKRISEITSRVRRDVDLLTDAYQELGELVGAAVAAQPGRASPPAPAAPAGATAASSSIDPSTRLIRLDAVCTRIGLGRSTIWRMTKDGEFPQPRRLSTHAVAWLEADVNEWVRARLVVGKPEQSPPCGRRRR
jgi:prophage regulatory protein